MLLMHRAGDEALADVVEHTVGRDDDSLDDGCASRRRQYYRVVRERPWLATFLLALVAHPNGYTRGETDFDLET